MAAVCQCEKLLYEFPTDLIEQADRIEILCMHMNSIPSIPDSIKQFTNLTQLNLKSNNITTISSAIGCLVHMTVFELDFNLVYVLPDTIGNLRSLREFSLFNNRLAMLPDTIGDLASLEFLDVRTNLLIALPISIGNLHKLKVLECYRNHISRVPDSIKYMQSLQHLDIQANGLNFLPECRLQSLTILKLQDNRLVSIDTLCTIIALKELYVGRNNITTLPAKLGKLKNLEILDIHGNKTLRAFPDSIGKLRKLRCLDWGMCPIHIFPASMEMLVNIENMINHVSAYTHTFDIVMNHASYDVPLPAICRFTISPVWANTLRVAPLYWHTRYNHRFSTAFQEMLIMFLACNRRDTKPYLPVEMIWEIFQFLTYE